MQHAAHGGNGDTSNGPRFSPPAGAPVGALGAQATALLQHIRFHARVVDGVFEEVDLFHWTTLEQPLVAVRFQPKATARLNDLSLIERP